MTRKNKLYKHHKSKNYFYIKDFSLAILGLLIVGAALTVPTYIASRKTEEVSLKADNIKGEQKDNNELDSLEEEDQDLLKY